MNVAVQKLIAIILGLFLVVVAVFIYYQKSKLQIIPVNQVTTKAEQAEQIAQNNTEIIRTEVIQCDNSVYIFDTVFIEDKSYFNDIYKNTRLAENFIVRLKPPQGDDLASFFVIAALKNDCDKIFLSVVMEETDVPMKGIFEWQVGDKEASKLTVSDKFASNYIPFRKKEWVSPDGGKIIVARPTTIQANGQQCNYQELLLIDLRQDTFKVLFTLANSETFDNGYSDLSPYCDGLNFGWLNESTIYYDVYNSETNYSFVEQRKLVIN